MANRNVVSNIAFVANIAWRMRKSTFLYMAANMLCTAASGIAAVLLPKVLIDEILGNGRIDRIFICLACLAALIALARHFAFWSQNRFASEFIWFKTIILAGDRFVSMDYEKTDDPRVIELSARVEDILSKADQGILGTLAAMSDTAGALLPFLLSAGIMATLNPMLIAFFVATALANYALSARAGKARHDSEAKAAPFAMRRRFFYGFMTDYGAGKETRLFQMRRYLGGQYEANARKAHECEAASAQAERNSAAAKSAVTALQELCVYGYLAYRVLAKGLSIGDFAAYAGATRLFVQSLESLFQSVARMRALCYGLATVRDFLEDGKTGARVSRDAEEMGGAARLGQPFSISLENVCFRYPGQQEYALENISLTIAKGERMALVGGNGAGKTTLAKLVMGLYSPTEGRVLLNGEDAAGMSPRSRFRAFSAVFQETEMYALTLAENISMAPIKKTDMRRVQDAAEQANIRELVGKLPLGLKTPMLKAMEEDGVELSEGEKQRVAIARAIYKAAPAFVMDEPTASMDPLAERKLYREIDRILGNRTTVFISHRLASVSFCDRVLMLDAGKVAECGAHGELVARGGAYSQLYGLQAQYYRKGAAV
ncbi:MAG: ATP-binding cassette domain-containing protein [Clostridiales bacterium]|jgi:ATP-binding cassette subfamily C protein|nr:ATP-binding cassette domain-containing protein [Clostridiales bacterium]